MGSEKLQCIKMRRDQEISGIRQIVRGLQAENSIQGLHPDATFSRHIINFKYGLSFPYGKL